METLDAKHVPLLLLVYRRTDSQGVDVGESLAISRQVKRGVHPIGVAMLHAIRVVRAPQAAPSARVTRGELLKIAKIAFRRGERRAERRRSCCPESAPGKNQPCQQLWFTKKRTMRMRRGD